VGKDNTSHFLFGNNASSCGICLQENEQGKIGEKLRVYALFNTLLKATALQVLSLNSSHFAEL
jgi:hypothetical protein